MSSPVVCMSLPNGPMVLNNLSDMPPLEVIETAGGTLVIFNGVTRATRSHMIDPNKTVPITVTQSYPNADTAHLPTIEQLLTIDF